MRNLKALLVLIALLSIGAINAYSLPLVDIGFQAGLSTPSEKMADIYNKNTLSDGVSKLYAKGISMGYYLGVKVRLNMSDNINFVGGLGYNKFPESIIDISNPSTPTQKTTLTYTTNIIPVTAGVNVYLIKSGIGIYGCGDLSYNYISSSVDAEVQGFPVSLSKSPTDNRMGFGLGAGVDLNLGITLLNLEGKYNYTNLIGKTSGEQSKSYFTLCLGVYL